MRTRHQAASNPVYTPVHGTTSQDANLNLLNETDYIGNKVYENGFLKMIVIEGGYIQDGQYYFYLADHLGNNRVVAKADGTVVQKNHYYPFGMEFAENSSDSDQPYKYNGKELDKMHGLNMYDYSARYMEPAIGRFTTVDPLAELYYSISPYAYCNNNPLRFIDPTGMAYTYVWPNEKTGEKGGYYINDAGKRVEWDEVQEWLTSDGNKKTDQDEEWGSISIFSNPGDASTSSVAMGKGRLGHAWIAINSEKGNKTTYGTFKKGVVGKTFQINFEKDNLYEALENASRKKSITNKQRLLIDLFNQITDNTDWSYGKNCTNYATNLWNYITGENLYSNDVLYKTPTELYNIIINLNAAEANKIINEAAKNQYPGEGLMPK